MADFAIALELGGFHLWTISSACSHGIQYLEISGYQFIQQNGGKKRRKSSTSLVRYSLHGRDWK